MFELQTRWISIKSASYSEEQSTWNEGPLLSYVSTFILNGNINVAAKSLSAVKIVVENTYLHQILALCN